MKRSKSISFKINIGEPDLIRVATEIRFFPPDFRMVILHPLYIRGFLINPSKQNRGRSKKYEMP